MSPLFKSSQGSSQKREVIIVITPFVLPEDQHQHTLAKHIPKDEDTFDTFGNQLFRDGYRIRAEDTFDLSYLHKNRKLQSIQGQVKTLVALNPALKERYPFDQFANGAIPGEDILVHRQIYEVVKRLGIDKNVKNGSLIYFQADTNLDAGFQVRFLEKILRSEKVRLTGDGGKKALALTYGLNRFSGQVGDILKEPVPAVSVIDCPDKDTWEKKLHEFNQPTADGLKRHTILLWRKDDLERLRRAVVINKIIELNDSNTILSLKAFQRGRLLAMPSVKKGEIELLDADVARCFYYSEQYYQALQEAIDSAADALARELGTETASL